ncbi:MAG: hypothetical protein HY720_06910 [Planctomycetes bacterium]|nr:hypothetical protein [Planctomycetota bacterium]
MRSRALALLFLASLGGRAAAQVEGLDYVKKETREETRKTTLARYVPEMDWGDWYIIGPFPNPGRAGLGLVYPPELEIDLAKSYPVRNGRTVSWKKAAGGNWERIDFKQFGNPALHDEGVAYLYREVSTPVAEKLTCEMGSDDGLKFWLNGNLLVDADVYRGLSVEDHQVDLLLFRGKNRILVKVSQGIGEWEFQMRPVLDSRILALLEYQLDVDFPDSPEAKHYRMLTLLEPEGVVLEVGGLDVDPAGRPTVATRRGEIWVVDDAYDENPTASRWTLFASGLHEPLGARWRDGALWVVQRPELTRLVDEDGDGRADLFETASDRWGISGNYHEFAFGPKFDGKGRFWVTLNLGFCGGLGKSVVPWRGWAVLIDPQDGALRPICGGLRSPNGLGANADGEMFYTDNQGDWVGTNKLSHLVPGDWHGHPSGKQWYERAGFPVPSGEDDFKPPAVWFPYGRMGQSASDIALDDTAGKFGPFAGQLFVGDQTMASVMRVFLERVGGEYQGACFPFRSGFDCGVNRLVFGPDGSLFVGMTDRGWGSVGGRRWGLQRLVYTGDVPFEVLSMRATPDGFELRFTHPVDRAAAGNPASYKMASFRYNRWETYGSPEVDRKQHRIAAARVSEDGLSVRLVVEGLRPFHVHELRFPGVRDAAGGPLLHAEAYYTLNRVPE